MEELTVLLEYYGKRVERNPQLLSSHAVYSEYLILSDRLDEAILISLKSLLVSPWFLRSQIDLGLSYLLKGDFKSSETELKHAIKIDPENDTSLFLLGLIYYLLGLNDISIEYLQEGFDYNPKNKYIRKLYQIITKKALPDISLFKELENKVVNGFITSEETLKIKNEKSGKKPYELLYAYSLKNENRLLEAIDIIERVLIYNPYYPNALFILGKFYEMVGDRRKRDECWEKCCDVNPLSTKIKNLLKNYENIHFDLNDLNELEFLLTKILDKTYDRYVKEVKVGIEEIPPQEEVVEKIIPVEEEVKAIKKDEKELAKEEKEEVFQLVEEIKLEEEIAKKDIISEKKEEIKLEEEVLKKEEQKKFEGEVEDSEYYKKLGEEYKKKGMYKEAIEMFTKALKLSKEKK